MISLKQFYYTESTTKRQSGKEFFTKLRMQPTRTILGMSKKSQSKFADRLRAAREKTNV